MQGGGEVWWEGLNGSEKRQGMSVSIVCMWTPCSRWSEAFPLETSFIGGCLNPIGLFKWTFCRELIAIGCNARILFQGTKYNHKSARLFSHFGCRKSQELFLELWRLGELTAYCARSNQCDNINTHSCHFSPRILHCVILRTRVPPSILILKDG